MPKRIKTAHGARIRSVGRPAIFGKSNILTGACGFPIGTGNRYSERWYAKFQRSFELGPDADPDKVGANFRKGVLTVTLGKRPEQKSQVKRISVSAEKE